MREFVLLCLVSVGQANPAPQYSGATGDLSDGTLDTIKDIFGAGLGDGTDSYSGGAETGKLDDGTNGGIGAVVQIVKNEDGYVAPDDYHTNEDQTKTTNNVDNVFEKCSDYTATQGYECVPYYQCDDGVIITDGGGLIDIRNGFGILSPEDSKCEGFLDVCCLDPDFEAPPPPPIVKHVPKCGQRHENGLGVRIQGFREGESQFGEWPHMCAVLSEEPISEGDPGYTQQQEQETVNLYQCGGSLIAPDTILTAAHCVDKFRENPTSLKIRCGEWDTQDQNEPRPHQDRYVTSLDIHPAFNGKNLANDWALLYTGQPFELQEHIDTVCLPSPGEQFAGQTCFATGWGKDKFGAAGQYQVVLKEIDLPVVGHDQCEAKLRTTRLGKRFQLDDSFICAGGQDGKDTCKGDGGSPLVCASKYDPYTYVQAGVVAWGIGCGEDNVPGVYASVPEAVCWIDYAMSCRANGGSSSYWGYGTECQDWWDTLHITLNNQVLAMQDTTLTGRKKVKALTEGTKAQKYLNYLAGCNLVWAQKSEPQTIGGGDGYGDISGNARVVDGAGSKGGSNSGLTTDSQGNPLVDPYPAPGSNNGAPLVDPYPVDPNPNAPLTGGDGTYTDDGSPVKITDGTYTGDGSPVKITDGTGSGTGEFDGGAKGAGTGY